MAEYDLEDTVPELGDARIGIAAARFNQPITDALLEGARRALALKGVDAESLVVVRVPGAFELPLAAARLAASRRVEAVIALGAVVRGDTPHFDYVCSEVSSGLMRVGLDHQLPVIFGVLTTDTMSQALARVGGEHGHKGEEAALAALEMIALLRRLAEA